jgi:hypothetical protein
VNVRTAANAHVFAVLSKPFETRRMLSPVAQAAKADK